MSGIGLVKEMHSQMSLIMGRGGMEIYVLKGWRYDLYRADVVFR